MKIINIRNDFLFIYVYEIFVKLYSKYFVILYFYCFSDFNILIEIYFYNKPCSRQYFKAIQNLGFMLINFNSKISIRLFNLVLDTFVSEDNAIV